MSGEHVPLVSSIAPPTSGQKRPLGDILHDEQPAAAPLKPAPLFPGGGGGVVSLPPISDMQTE